MFYCGQRDAVAWPYSLDDGSSGERSRGRRVSDHGVSHGCGAAFSSHHHRYVDRFIWTLLVVRRSCGELSRQKLCQGALMVLIPSLPAPKLGLWAASCGLFQGQQQRQLSW